MAKHKYILLILFCFIFSKMNGQCLTDYYYQKAIEKTNDVDALYYLAEHFYDGNGAPKDVDKAITLWRIIASQNGKLGIMRLSSFIRGASLKILGGTLEGINPG